MYICLSGGIHMPLHEHNILQYLVLLSVSVYIYICPPSHCVTFVCISLSEHVSLFLCHACVWTSVMCEHMYCGFSVPGAFGGKTCIKTVKMNKIS